MLKKIQEYKEKYIPGECIFPFGETLYQQAAASFVIEQDLKGGMYIPSLLVV
jgi:hypothetical protein